MFLQTPPYIEAPDGARVGRMENICLENIEVNACEPVDKLSNYLTGNPIVGHFGAFELGSNINSVTFKNVRVWLNKEKYPLSHFVTVGPKSSYIERSELGMFDLYRVKQPELVEIFDPYVVNKVDKIVCKNVKINNRKLKDPQKEIIEISFPDDMYKNQFGKGGNGKIGEITFG